MQLWSVEGNRQRLDGGAMFGNCPKALWQRWCPPDPDNRIELACRALLIREAQGRNVLLEAGIGAFFPPKLRDRYGVSGTSHVLLDELAQLGMAPEDIDLVVLSHLHFDHAGGLLSAWQPDHEPTLVFPKARFLVGRAAWERQKRPHPRDRASYIPELGELLTDSGRLELVDGDQSPSLGERYRFRFSDGHTPGLMLTRVEAEHPGPITFVADLIPARPWLHAPLSMGYDRYPELLIDEKRALLEQICARDEWVFFTHDAEAAACRVGQDERGRYSAREVLERLRGGP